MRSLVDKENQNMLLAWQSGSRLLTAGQASSSRDGQILIAIRQQYALNFSTCLFGQFQKNAALVNRVIPPLDDLAVGQNGNMPQRSC